MGKRSVRHPLLQPRLHSKMSYRPLNANDTMLALRRGDPKFTSLTLVFRMYDHPRELKLILHELKKNQHVNTLKLDFEGMAGYRMNYGHIVSVLESRSMLQAVFLIRSVANATGFLLAAVAKNSNVQVVGLVAESTVSAKALSDFLKQTKSLKTLQIEPDGIVESRDYNTAELELAFRANACLENVHIQGHENEYMLTLILRGIGANSKISQLSVHGFEGEHLSRVALNAIRYCVDNSSSLKTIDF